MDKRIITSKKWREQNPDKWREINRKNQAKWQKERCMDRILEKHERALADDPERLSTSFLQKLILNRRKEKVTENGS